MTEEARDFDAEVPEADRLDQNTPVLPDDEEPVIAPLREAKDAVSESDWVDQQKPVPLDEDDEADEGGGA